MLLVAKLCCTIYLIPILIPIRKRLKIPKICSRTCGEQLLQTTDGKMISWESNKNENLKFSINVI